MGKVLRRPAGWLLGIENDSQTVLPEQQSAKGSEPPQTKHVGKELVYERALAHAEKVLRGCPDLTPKLRKLLRVRLMLAFKRVYDTRGRFQ